jgi:lysophospholipase L1-like esterase
MAAPDTTKAIVAFGDSITDGTSSTLNGDDRWPDVLARRLHAAYGARVAVVNAGIGGNELLGPAQYTPDHPSKGGPAALARLDRDVLELSGVGTVIWMEGINDYNEKATTEAMLAGIRQLVQRVHARGLRIIGGTLTSALHSDNGEHGTAEVDAKRKAQNDFIRSSGVFDGVVDFDRATLDPATGELRPEFVPNTTGGGPGDKLHPNRAGYLAMGNAVDLRMLTAGGTAGR